MISIFTSWGRSNHDGGAWLAQHELRHDVFIDRLSYDVNAGELLEFDQYDNPHATYCVVMHDGQAVACCRLIPFSRSIMVQDCWPELLGDFDTGAWGLVEATRICVRKESEPAKRRQALDLLVLSILEWAVKADLKGIIGVMPQALFKRVLEGRGCSVRYLAPPLAIDGKPTVAGLIYPASSLCAVRQRLGNSVA